MSVIPWWPIAARITFATGFYDSAYAYPNPNPGVAGWCTWYAWQWRHDNLGDNYTLPSNSAGNATSWDNNLAGQFYIDYNPAYGDVFVQDYSVGYYASYGHVGIVTGVNGDGTITYCDMNGSSGFGRVGCNTTSNWRGWHFIHQRIGT